MTPKNNRPLSSVGYMKRALALARRGGAAVRPNPMVGALVVSSKGDIVGEGWHQKAGDAHAEVFALQEAGDAARGATVYVTLEPCNHRGKTAACTEALIAAGVRKVVAAMRDPNPNVCGGGIERLREAGIEVEVGVCEEQARGLNRGWIFRLKEGRALHELLVCLSLDGRVLMPNRVLSEESVFAAWFKRISREYDRVFLDELAEKTDLSGNEHLVISAASGDALDCLLSSSRCNRLITFRESLLDDSVGKLFGESVYKEAKKPPELKQLDVKKLGDAALSVYEIVN